ncbi:insulinase family protein [Tichowtungia aerotolerans]|uniref:Peptidase M16 n=1 Tax=Tichowtungia aerotolerans TaxID=2697043 RepID=A0A6P1M6P9_9BACT|nr:insulinase family protein [Tichowtungia aerotolerans]QHI69692.1 peptidase M16 [Tichowtungia aerotolerans]
METQFKLIRETAVAELNGIVKEYRHEPTGAEYISVENNDNNKVFGITFRTPPSDSTGVAHILEHTVLCGSRKYPLKDPFVQLLKGSLQTFLNAMTYPDKTVYPVASQNVQDFYNLVDVYLDAVFFPRITPAFFRQEGWHYELEGPDAPLTCKGVVYNEMKGAYSSPDSLLLERSQQSLFPDTTYSLDSGGNPSVIPTLTYGEFREFHETWYHPSNARIFFYGNDDPAKRLEILEEYLGGFQSLENPPDSSIPLQPSFKKPALIKETFAAGDEDSKAFVTVNWALPEGSLHFALTVLDHILTGTSGSPLRKALIESGLGEDIAGFGLETHLRQPAYSIGMKGVDTPNLGKVEKLIFQTLEKLVQDGIDPGDIDAALNSFEFDLRENNRGSCPQGLSVMLTMLETWLYDWDPLVLAAYEKPLAGLKQALADNPRYFEELIENSLLKNPHRSVVRLIPDAFKAEREDAEDAAVMQAVKDAMIPDEIKRTMTAAERLLDMQKAPDSPAAIKTIPLLCRNDLRKEVRVIPREIETFDNATVLFHDLFTGGIAYIDIGLDLHVLDTDDLPWVSLLGSMLLEMGTQKESFASLSQRIARKTGGIYAAPVHAVPEQSPESVSRLFLRGKCMANRIEDLFSIISDILFLPAFDNIKRFKEVLLEQKAEMESGLVPNGHTAVLSRLKAHYHEASRAAEAMGGIDALFFHREIEQRVDDEWAAILERIETILKKMLAGGLVVNVTADNRDRAVIFQSLEKFLCAFPTMGNNLSNPWAFKADLPKSEALTAPSRVNYVGSAINLFDNHYQHDGSALVVTKYLRTAWLWEKIRVQGGAYGALCTFEPCCGVFAFASYRDPNLADTLEVYAQTGEFLKNLDIDQDELSRALIGAIGGIDTYRLPDAKGYCDTLRWLTGITDEKRQQRRNEILATTVEHFRQFGEFLDMHDAVTAVLGSKESIELSNVPFERHLKVL